MSFGDLITRMVHEQINGRAAEDVFKAAAPRREEGAIFAQIMNDANSKFAEQNHVWHYLEPEKHRPNRVEAVMSAADASAITKGLNFYGLKAEHKTRGGEHFVRVHIDDALEKGMPISSGIDHPNHSGVYERAFHAIGYAEKAVMGQSYSADQNPSPTQALNAAFKSSLGATTKWKNEVFKDKQHGIHGGICVAPGEDERHAEALNSEMRQAGFGATVHTSENPATKQLRDRVKIAPSSSTANQRGAGYGPLETLVERARDAAQGFARRLPHLAAPAHQPAQPRRP